MKKWLLPIILLLVFSMTACAPQAQQGTGSTDDLGLWAPLEKILRAVTVDLPALIQEEGGYDSPKLQMWLRLIFMLMLFAVLYAALSAIAGSRPEFTKNIRLSLSLLIAAMSTIFIPTQLLVGVAQAYGVAFYGGMLALLLIGAGYILWGGHMFRGHTRFDYFGKFVISGIVTASLTLLSGAEVGVYKSGEHIGQAFAGITNITALSSGIFFFLTIWYLWNMIMAGPHVALAPGVAVPVSAAAAGGGKVAGWADKWWAGRKHGRSVRGKLEGAWSEVVTISTGVQQLIADLRRGDVSGERIAGLLVSYKTVITELEVAARQYVIDGDTSKVNHYTNINKIGPDITNTLMNIVANTSNNNTYGNDFLESKPGFANVKGKIQKQDKVGKVLLILNDMVMTDIKNEVDAMLLQVPATPATPTTP